MRNLTLATSILLCLIFPAASFSETIFPPQLSELGKNAFSEKYLQAKGAKAFAVSAKGNFYFVSELQTQERAARTALLRCLNAHGIPCQVWMINEENVSPVYVEAENLSISAIASLPLELKGNFFGAEDTDVGVVPLDELRDGALMHSATPAASTSGFQVITTPQLLNLYRSLPDLVVLDVLLDQQFKKETLPKAIWLNGAGMSQPEKNKAIESNLSKVIPLVVSRKEQAVVVYCSGWECWLSWNASKRLAALGYKNVYWYRGGMQAWKAARLPTVITPIAAQLW